jgi:hypothetical protein
MALTTRPKPSKPLFSKNRQPHLEVGSLICSFRRISVGAKLGTFCRMFNLNSDNYTQFLGEWFGRHWVYHLRPLIQAIKLPEFYPANESSEASRRFG